MARTKLSPELKRLRRVLRRRGTVEAWIYYREHMSSKPVSYEDFLSMAMWAFA